jgi:hypothetical protein
VLEEPPDAPRPDRIKRPGHRLHQRLSRPSPGFFRNGALIFENISSWGIEVERRI